MRGVAVTAIVLLWACLETTVTALSCRQCLTIELVEPKSIKSEVENAYRQLGLLDPDCKEGGVQGDSTECPAQATGCGSSSLRMTVEQSGISITVDGHARECQAIVPNGNQCIDDIDDYKDEILAFATPSLRHLYQNMEGRVCFCGTKDNCNDQKLEFVNTDDIDGEPDQYDRRHNRGVRKHPTRKSRKGVKKHTRRNKPGDKRHGTRGSNKGVKKHANRESKKGVRGNDMKESGHSHWSYWQLQ